MTAIDDFISKYLADRIKASMKPVQTTTTEHKSYNSKQLKHLNRCKEPIAINCKECRTILNL